MKKLIAIAILTLSTTAYACTIDFVKTSAKSKTAYLNTVAVSENIRTELAKSCKLNIKVMTEMEKLDFDIARTKAKLAKLQSKNK